MALFYSNVLTIYLTSPSGGSPVSPTPVSCGLRISDKLYFTRDELNRGGVNLRRSNLCRCCSQACFSPQSNGLWSANGLFRDLQTQQRGCSWLILYVFGTQLILYACWSSFKIWGYFIYLFFIVSFYHDINPFIYVLYVNIYHWSCLLFFRRILNYCIRKGCWYG